MTTRTDSVKLLVARRARDAARERSADRIGRPNLSLVGREKPLVAPTALDRPKSAAALKTEYGNGREKSAAQVDREVVGDSIVLKSRVRALNTAQGNVGQKKQALKLAPTLTVPMARNSRATNKDGATSFHFKHEAIAKTRVEKTSASGTKTRKNAGRDHSKYLERDSAVALHGEAIDLVGLTGQGQAVDAIGHAAAGGLYIEREEALAHQENGVAVIYSNISQNGEERHQFWELVEKHETEPDPDHLNIITGQDLEFWEAVRTDPRCPTQLALAIDDADPAQPCRIRTDDNEPIREIMADHGWAPPSPRNRNETASEKAERKRLDQENSKGAHCEDGRGGQIQIRIVGELPYEVRHEQRIRILRRFAAEFEERNLPYVAVMHAPDYANDDKNWHFHLAYYGRPCDPFTGEADDYLTKLNPNANWHDKARHKAKDEAFQSGQFERYVGQLDFSVPMVRKDSSRHTVTTYPFAQEKLRECAHRDWPLQLRKILAELTNDELEIAGSDRRVDPRRFPEMGINKESEEHIGIKGAQMESLGIATPRGVENEHKQWQYTLDAIDRKFKADERNTTNEERRWRQILESRALNPTDHTEVSKMITNWAQTQSHANELTAIATELKKHLERAQSRANKVQETCNRHLEAISAGRASKRQSGNKTNYEARLIEATDHLSGLTINMANEVVHEKRSREEALRLTGEATRMRKAIDDRLQDDLAATMATWLPAKAKAKKRGPANDVAPANVNDDINVEAKPVLNRIPSEHLLRQTDIERFIRHLVNKNRRLEKVGGYLVPVKPTDEEKHIISARNYADLQPRLLKLKTAQDQHIDRLSSHILAHPEVIKLVPGEAGASDPRYVLMSNDGYLQRAFKGFATEGSVRTAIETALEARQNGGGNGVAPSAASNDAGRARAGSQAPAVSASSPNSGAADSTVGPYAKPNSLTEVMRKISQLADAGEPIMREIKDGRTVCRLAEQNMQALELTERDIGGEPVQGRLRAIHKQQENDIRRLVGFISRNPARATISAPTILTYNQPVVALARDVPRELLLLSHKYALNPVAQEQMRDALREAKAGTEKKAAEASVATGRTEQQGGPTPESAGNEAGKGDGQNPGLSTSGAKHADAAPNNIEPLGVKAKSRDLVDSYDEDKDAAATPHAKKVVVGKTVFEEAAEEKSAVEISPADRPDPASESLLNAEERAELLRPRKFGMEGGSEPVSGAAKVEETIHSGTQPSNIPRSVHPKIDAWIDALNSRNSEARQTAALMLKEDGEALKMAYGALDAKTQARIRIDWEAQEARNRTRNAAKAERANSSARTPFDD